MKIQHVKKIANLDLKYLNNFFKKNEECIKFSYKLETYLELKKYLEILTLNKELEECLENKQKEKKKVKI